MKNEKGKIPSGMLPPVWTTPNAGRTKKTVKKSVRIMKNDKGEPISGIKKLIRPEFGTGEIQKDGQPKINWSYLSKDADDDGFDKRNVESNGEYRIEITLPYGTRIIRYGSEMGHFTAPKGTPYEKLALPYIKDTVEYNEYKVIADNIRVFCVVKKGIVAPGFDSDGGATQFWHPITIQQSIRKGLLERISL